MADFKAGEKYSKFNYIFKIKQLCKCHIFIPHEIKNIIFYGNSSILFSQWDKSKIYEKKSI